MSTYRGNEAQRIKLHSALKELHERGVTDLALTNAINKAKSANQIAEFPQSNATSVSRATINRYRKSLDRTLAVGRRDQIALVYNFLAQSNDFPTALLDPARQVQSSHALAPLLQMMMAHVGPRHGQILPDDMESLAGTYHVYRRAWTSQDDDAFIVTVMVMHWIGNGLFFEDEQSYRDPSANQPIDERDVGLALPFGMNVVLLARGENHEVLKFYSIDDMYPFPDRRRPVLRFSGNAIAVSGKGPHPGYPIAALRAEPNDLTGSKMIHRSELPQWVVGAFLRLAQRKAPESVSTQSRIASR